MASSQYPGRMQLVNHVIHQKTGHTGGRPSLQEFDIKKRGTADFKRLLHLDPKNNDYIVTVYENIKDRLVEGVYPIADTPGGDCICFDYRFNQYQPSIVYWDHELAYENPEKGLFFVANTFTELLNKLYDEDE